MRTRLRNGWDLLLFLLFFPALVFAVAIVLAVGPLALAAAVGGGLAVWIWWAYVFQCLIGAMDWSEPYAIARSRWRWRRTFDGELLTERKEVDKW